MISPGCRPAAPALVRQNLISKHSSSDLISRKHALDIWLPNYLHVTLTPALFSFEYNICQSFPLQPMFPFLVYGMDSILDTRFTNPHVVQIMPSRNQKFHTRCYILYITQQSFSGRDWYNETNRRASCTRIPLIMTQSRDDCVHVVWPTRVCVNETNSSICQEKSLQFSSQSNAVQFIRNSFKHFHIRIRTRLNSASC